MHGSVRLGSLEVRCMLGWFTLRSMNSILSRNTSFRAQTGYCLTRAFQELNIIIDLIVVHHTFTECRANFELPNRYLWQMLNRSNSLLIKLTASLDPHTKWRTGNLVSAKETSKSYISYHRQLLAILLGLFIMTCEPIFIVTLYSIKIIWLSDQEILIVQNNFSKWLWLNITNNICYNEEWQRYLVSC